MLLNLVEMVYWLALSTWFGGVLFIAASAPVIAKAIKNADPLLPTVLSVNLEGQHGTLLTSGIIAELIAMLTRIEFMCAGVLLLCIGAQWLLDGYSVPLAVRSAIYVVVAGIVVYDWWLLWPKISKAREEFIAHADDPEIANPARERLQRLDRQRVTLLTLQFAFLLAMVLFSTAVHQPAIVYTGGHGG
jgi:hypothetical protein